LLLLDILAAADAVRGFLGTVPRAEFLADDELRSSVLLKLLIIGEAASKLPAEFRQMHGDIPWSEIIAFRNLGIHSYLAIDWEIVWDTATVDAPALRNQVAGIMTREYPEVRFPPA
jgi:uncharacterized protein with HEPN domain